MNTNSLSDDMVVNGVTQVKRGGEKDKETENSMTSTPQAHIAQAF
jgi:hypothetical protein